MTGTFSHCAHLLMLQAGSPAQCPVLPHFLHSVRFLSSSNFFLRSAIDIVDGRTGNPPLRPLPLPLPLPLVLRNATACCTNSAAAGASTKACSSPMASTRHATLLNS